MSEPRQITIGQRLEEINKQYQTLYAERNDLTVFSFTVTNILDDLMELLEIIEPLAVESLRITVFKNNLTSIKQNHAKPEYDRLDHWEKNNNLAWSKRDVLKICLEISQEFRYRGKNIFNQVIEIG